MDLNMNRRAILLWSLGFAAAYLVLSVSVSVLADRGLHLAAWLPAPLLWLVGAVLDGSYLLPAGGGPRAASPGRPARIVALRWVLCVLILANAALLLWRAFQPGDSTLVVAGLQLRLLPLDVRLAPTGPDPLALVLGVALAFLGLSELRLRLAGIPREPASAA